RICLNLINEIPNGKYHAIDYMEDDGFNQALLKIEVNITITDQSIAVDFDGTSDQSKGNINCPLSVAAAAVYYVFRCLMPDNTPASAGSFEPIKIKSGKPCLVNAVYPSAVAAGNVETSSRIVDVILAALQKALPDRIPAASYGTMNNIAMGNNIAMEKNLDQSTINNKQWSYYETIAGGFGASAASNGISAQQAHMTNTLNTPIESFESHYPVRITKYEIRTDNEISDEAEETPSHQESHQGGMGLIRCYEFLKNTQVTLLTERRKISPWGVNGAKQGLVGENLLDGKKIDGKTSLKVKTGQKLCIKTPNGGSWRPIS
ncbi:MAG: hydantoinase B/oxoprolinase family protein, partial [Gammaproteobacteria bacterium]|nr:hydantoinase B/oxoprolinase family protein [Gammaproteobacteria bacterium]